MLRTLKLSLLLAAVIVSLGLAAYSYDQPAGKCGQQTAQAESQTKAPKIVIRRDTADATAETSRSNRIVIHGSRPTPENADLPRIYRGIKFPEVDPSQGLPQIILGPRRLPQQNRRAPGAGTKDTQRAASPTSPVVPAPSGNGLIDSLMQLSQTLQDQGVLEKLVPKEAAGQQPGSLVESLGNLDAVLKKHQVIERMVPQAQQQKAAKRSSNGLIDSLKQLDRDVQERVLPTLKQIPTAD